jgi:hypothetical protein
MAKVHANRRSRVKSAVSRGFFRRWKWLWIVLLVLLLIPAMQVAVGRFIDPPRTLPMWIEQASESGGEGAVALSLDSVGADAGDVPEAPLDFGRSDLHSISVT